MFDLAVAGPPKSTALTDVSTFQAESGVTGDSILLKRLIRQATSAIEAFLGRPLYRAQYTERFRGNDQQLYQLHRYPVASLDAVSIDGDAQTVTDYTVADRETGLLYLRSGFTRVDNPIYWSFTYTAGYFLVGDDYTAATISAAASDDSFNDSASGFHPYLKADDLLETNGFSNAANITPPKLVVSSATTAKIVVESSLTDEAAGSSVTLRVENVPGELVDACHILVRNAYQARDREADLSKVTVGPLKFEYGSGSTASPSRSLGQVRDLLWPHRSP